MKCIVMMEGSTKIVIFITSGAKILMLGCGNTSHQVRICIFKKNSSVNPDID